ncbi:MAG: hypothetical protein JWL90_2803 [Chthoniobacteraceae bacterium]|nr:hypothetical protein [Chthoniobacteraceae bacterium]
MILQRLRGETGELHRALEQRLPLIDTGLSCFDYESILERFYGYYIPLETRLSALQLWAARVLSDSNL